MDFVGLVSFFLVIARDSDVCQIVVGILLLQFFEVIDAALDLPVEFVGVHGFVVSVDAVVDCLKFVFDGGAVFVFVVQVLDCFDIIFI